VYYLYLWACPHAINLTYSQILHKTWLGAWWVQSHRRHKQSPQRRQLTVLNLCLGIRSSLTLSDPQEREENAEHQSTLGDCAVYVLDLLEAPSGTRYIRSPRPQAEIRMKYELPMPTLAPTGRI
jgi:hypothetical protein